MVAVVQLVEHQVVILAVAGSSPVSHPAGREASSPPGIFSLARLQSHCNPRRSRTRNRRADSGNRQTIADEPTDYA
jgi:hypothetical protein